MPEQQILSLEQVLLTTLVVKLAVMAALATMLARYRRFRHMLIFERRDWRDRLIFVLFFGIPLAAGVAARLLLNYKAADLSLEGAFVAGLVAGPYAGAVVGALVGLPPLGNGEIIALPFAVGCGFAGGGLRELCPKEAIWHFSPFVVTSLPRRVVDDDADAAGRLAGGAAACADRSRTAAAGPRRALERAPSPVLSVAERLGLDDVRRPARHRAVGGDADQDLEQRPHRAPAGRSRKRCCWRPRSRRSPIRSTRISCSIRSPRSPR